MSKPNPLAGVREELRQVTWPSRQEATELTITVIIISLIVALFVGIIDFSLAKVLEMLSQ
jgi:preprotein translocase subunit SecE